MKLHRADSIADWANLPASELTSLQRLAARTNGYATPGNIVTIAGFGLVVWGLVELLYHHYWLAFSLIIVGRLCDLLDGFLADRTGTKSPLGENLDAGFDKLGTVVTLVTLAVANITAWWVLLLLLIPHVAIALIYLLADHNHVKLHPSRLGKLSMFGLWVSLGGYLGLAALNLDNASVLRIVIGFIVAASVISGSVTAATYLQQAVKK